jgi:acyl carrier protein
MSSNNEKYQTIFQEVFTVTVEDLNDELRYQSIASWDSVGHMELMSRLEDEFGINLEMDDVIDFGSYLMGKKILEKYGVII